MEDLFSKYKGREQEERDAKEIHGLMDSLGSSKEGFRRILGLKRRFMSGKQYHHVLSAWAKDLDAIFEACEKELR
jgi:hypothetical protein